MANSSDDHKHPRKSSHSEPAHVEVLDTVKSYAKGINSETITYVILAVGLVLLMMMPLLGQIIIGLLAGYIFQKDIIRWVTSLKQKIESEAVMRGVVLGVVLLAFFIEAPAIVIGAAISVGLSRLISKK